jgi:hypothetical protein
LCDRRQHDWRCGNREIEPVMLAHRKYVEAGLVGKIRGGEDVLESLLGADAPSVRSVRRKFAKRIEPDLHHLPPKSTAAVLAPEMLGHSIRSVR